MKLRVLGSSSAGNSYLLKSSTGTLIIECGIKYRDILQGLDFDLGSVVGTLATHQHLDHSKSANDLIKAGIDVYTNTETIEALGLEGHRVYAIEPLQQFVVGDFRVLPFPIQHDVPGLGFLIEYVPTGYRLVFLTDTFYCKYRFPNLNGILVECNYIKETLDQNIEDGFIPIEYKQRLLQSHFSLENVKEFLKANDLSQCSIILLIHLSAKNSDEKQMVREIEAVTGIKPKVADRGMELELSLYPY